MSAVQPHAKRSSTEPKRVHSTSSLDSSKPLPVGDDDDPQPKRRARRRGKRGGGSARRKSAGRAAALANQPLPNSGPASSALSVNETVRKPDDDCAALDTAPRRFATPLAPQVPAASSSGFTLPPFPPATAPWLTPHAGTSTSPINPVFGKGVEGFVPSETEASRAPSGVTSVLLHRPPIATGLTASSTTDPRPAVPRGYVGNRLPIPVDNLPATKPFSFDTPNISAAEIGVPKAYNAEYPHPLTAYASPAVNASTVSTSGYDELLSELLDNDPGAAMGSILANSGKEGIGPPALSLRPGAEDGCGIPENLWLQLTTWASVKVPVGAVVPMSHPSRFNPGPRFAAMPDRSRKVLPPVAARQHIGTEPSPSSDVSSLRRSLSTGDLDTFLRSWSELATATRLADGHRRSSFPNSDYSPPFYRQGHLASQSPLDLPSTSQFRPRMSLPFNLLSPVAEEETPPPTGASVEQRSPFPSPFNHGGFLADTDTPKDPTEFIPSVWDEPRDPDASSYLAATPLTPPLDWPMERHEEKPPWVIERYEEKSPDGRHEQPQHTSHIHFPAVLLPSDDEWAPATTTLDFSTGNSIWV